MNRRDTVLALLALGIASRGSFAQQPGSRVYRIGFLTTNSAPLTAHLLDAFTRGLSELGYVEGKNVVIERRFADGNMDRLPMLVADLLQQNVDIIFASNTPSVQAAREATSSIPIVFALV